MGIFSKLGSVAKIDVGAKTAGFFGKIKDKISGKLASSAAAKKAKDIATYDVSAKAKEKLAAADRVTDEYIPTLKKAPGAVWGAGAAAAAGLGGLLSFGKRTTQALAVHGTNTWLFMLICGFAHFSLIIGNIPAIPISFASLTDIFNILRMAFSTPIFGVYLLLPFLAAFMFFSDGSGISFRQVPKFMGLTLLAYLLPVVIANLSPVVPPEYKMLLIILMALTPLWLIYIFQHSSDKITRFFGFIWVLAITFFLLANLFIFLNLGDTIQSQAPLLFSPGEMKDVLAQSWQKFTTVLINGPKQAYENSKKFLKGTMSYATQEYYTGTVDQTQGAPIGVFIDSTKPLLTKFYIDTDDVVVFATMKAKTFSNNIHINNGCYLESSTADTLTTMTTQHRDGVVKPNKVDIDYTGEFQDSYDLECDIAADKVKEIVPAGRMSTPTVVFNSTFNFETWAYMPYSFMDRDLVVSLRRNNLDPAQQLKVSPNPIAKYTPGPVMLGMASDSQPYAYQTPPPRQKPSSLPAFGVTFSNAWQGKGTIDHFTLVKFYIPKPFKLNGADCAPKQTFVSPPDWTENNAYRVYTPNNVKISPGEMYTTVRCPLDIESDDINMLTLYPVLGSSGAGVFTFFVEANYTYNLSTRTVVGVMGPGQAATPGSATTTTAPAQSPALTAIETDCAQHSSCTAGSCICTYDYNGKPWHCRYGSDIHTRTCYSIIDDSTKHLCRYTPESCQTCPRGDDFYSC